MTYDKEEVRRRMNRETLRSRGSKPDWGHGPNPPIPMYDLDRIGRVFKAHYPNPVPFEDGDVELRCSCSHTAGTWPDGEPKYAFVEWTGDHFLDELRKAT